MSVDEEKRLAFLDRMSRRRFLAGAGGLAGAALAAPLLPRPALAAEQVRFCSWGGSLQDLQREHVLAPFQAASGIKVVEDSLPFPSRIKAMVDSGNLEFDVVETDLLTILSLEEMGEYFEPIDYSALSPAALAGIPEGLRLPKAIGYFYWSYNIGYRTDKFGGASPQSWADVWDTAKFPGGRTLCSADDGQYPNLEFALLADGVAKDALYPIDVDRAFASLDRIKPSVRKWWSSGSEVVQLFTSGEVTAGSTYSGRLMTAKAEGAPVDLSWNDGQASLDYLMIVKGADMGPAMKLIDALLQVQPSIAIFNEYAGGPANAEVLAGLKPGRAAELPSYPDNLARMYVQDSKWWADNLGTIVEKFHEWSVL
ncbi:ABC transporter substrate-binding protein [Propylenella binzhouense]|uniref:ABC transporter substrate-binding protein n=1 Tax=Propylenella binzhouense TaxID=2555902 RepID=A0A964T5N9_9HYPH|nr:ABC transporter substrate-binding protein [Propylenella binzhouense]MYZ48610.1 ABC transporter substrate-binding protein [Propylenella binzhouense]